MGINLDDVLGNKKENILEDKSKKQMNMLMAVIVVIIIIILVVTFKMWKEYQNTQAVQRIKNIGNELQQLSIVLSEFNDLHSEGSPEYLMYIGRNQEEESPDNIISVKYGGQTIEYKYGYYFITKDDANDARLLGKVPTAKASSSKGYAVNYFNGDVVYLDGVAFQGNTYYEKKDIDAVVAYVNKVPNAKIPARVIISSAEELNSKMHDSNNLNANFILNRDIDMSSINSWTPVGTGDAKFSGTFDGKGYKIINLKIDRTNVSNTGLFGYVGPTATINNLVLVNADVAGGENTGIVAAVFEGIINNSKIGGNVNSGSSDNAGGVFGTFNGTANNILCSVNVNGKNNVGGFAGNVQGGKIANVFVNSGLKIAGERSIGGFIGIITNSREVNIDKCYSKANVSSSEGRAGGFVGFLSARSANAAYTTTIKHSYSQGQITTCYTDGGGFVGELLSEGTGPVTISKSYTNTQVDRNCTTNRGGFIGRINDNATINFDNSYWIKANNDNDITGKEIVGVGNEKIAGEFLDSLSQNFSINELNGWNDGSWKLSQGVLPAVEGEPAVKDWNIFIINK